MASETQRAACAVLLAAGLASGPGCTGAVEPMGGDGDGDGTGGAGANAGTGGSRPGAGGSGTVTNPGSGWDPVPACAPTQPRRVTRLSDRHLANAIRDLLGLAKAPTIQTTAGDIEAFIPNKAAALSGAVALDLQKTVEAASVEATAAGKPAVVCAGTERDCARTFIDKFASRAFRHPVTNDERDKLLAAYDAGRVGGTHADGMRTVIEAVLQAPSFVYHTELGAKTDGKWKLSQYELATSISLFLRDSLPDDALWKAATDGKLANAAGVAAEVDRLLATPEVKANVSRMLRRMFQLDRMARVTKGPTIKEFTPTLATSMLQETERFIDDVLWKRGGKLTELLTSRTTSVDKAVAELYGVAHPGSGVAEVALPPERAGILTQPSLLTIEATPDDSSIVHRGVFVAREMLCFHPPPPSADDLAAGEALKKNEPTERLRMEKRMATPRCAGCHGFFDPFGVNYENYDTLGRHRTVVKTESGDFPVDSSWNAKLYDVTGKVANAIELADKLSKSRAVKACLARQFASYAVQHRITDEELCTTSSLAEQFEASGGDLLKLVRGVAVWEGLRDRTEGVAP